MSETRNSLRIQQLPADKKSQHLPSKDLGRPHVVKRAHPLEDTRLIHPALGYQKMQMRVEIDAVSKGPDDDDNAEFNKYIE
ncbi:MAG: hypothetical protein ABSF88_05480 [Candidatus Aminicenantales bacterium]